MKRLKWARAHVNWTTGQWNSVIFSDESRFCTVSDSPVLVRRSSGELLRPESLQRTTKHPPSVMIWGCMTSTGVGRMEFVMKTMNSDQYRKILQDKLLRTAREKFGDSSWLYQQDLAPCHASKKMKESFAENEIDVLDWPGCIIPKRNSFSPLESLEPHDWLLMMHVTRLLYSSNCCGCFTTLTPAAAGSCCSSNSISSRLQRATRNIINTLQQQAAAAHARFFH